jgi:hypothetical protein
MTNAQWLLMVRRRVAEVDVTASDYDDVEFLEAAADALEYLAMKNVAALDGLAVDLDVDSATYGLTPDPTRAQAQLLLLRVAHQVLAQRYTERLMRGEIGTSWRSGLEEESSIQAEKAYRGMLDRLAGELDELVLITKASTAGDRVQ